MRVGMRVSNSCMPAAGTAQTKRGRRREDIQENNLVQTWKVYYMGQEIGRLGVPHTGNQQLMTRE